MKFTILKLSIIFTLISCNSRQIVKDDNNDIRVYTHDTGSKNSINQTIQGSSNQNIKKLKNKLIQQKNSLNKNKKISHKKRSKKEDDIEKKEDIKPINIEFFADVLSANRELKAKGKKSKKLKTYNYTIICNLDNQGREIGEGDLEIGTILYIRGQTRQKKEKVISLKELSLANINDPKPTPIEFPIKESDGHRIFRLEVPKVPRSQHRVALHITLKHKDRKKPIYTKLLTLHNPGEEDNLSFFSKANDKKWWWLTSGLAATSLSLGAIAIGLALG